MDIGKPTEHNTRKELQNRCSGSIGLGVRHLKVRADAELGVGLGTPVARQSWCRLFLLLGTVGFVPPAGLGLSASMPHDLSQTNPGFEIVTAMKAHSPLSASGHCDDHRFHCGLSGSMQPFHDTVKSPNETEGPKNCALGGRSSPMKERRGGGQGWKRAPVTGLLLQMKILKVPQEIFLKFFSEKDVPPTYQQSK